jgi:hypothetical protein
VVVFIGKDPIDKRKGGDEVYSGVGFTPSLVVYISTVKRFFLEKDTACAGK